jgi:hypothetical protein
MTVTPHGEVTKFEGYEELIKKIAGEDAEARKIVQAVLGEEYLKRSATEVFGVLPPGPVKGGDKWGADKKQEIPLGPLGSFTITREFTYDGKGNLNGQPFDKITFTATASYNPPKPGATGSFPFQVTKGDLKASDLKGTVWFDASAGRLVGMETSMRLKGTLSVTASGNTFDAELDQERTTKTRVLDKPPQ